MTTVDPDRLASLEEERRFLLRSLADLERERAAGDVDDVDYHDLKEGYTVRAAAVLRAIDEGRSTLPERSPVDWRRRLLIGVGVLAVIAVVGVVLAATSAERTPGQNITGLDPRSEQQALLAEARAVQAQDPAAAAEIYAEVLVDDPDNVEALTYGGWSLALDAVNQPDSDAVATRLRDGIDSLLRAADTDPTYADPHCFLGIVYFNFLGQADLALAPVERCLELNPPADVRGLVEGLLARIEAAIDEGSG